MAAPTHTTRVTPVGTAFMLENGYRSLITFAADPDVSLWELTITGLSLTTPGKINISTMWNEDYETYATPALIDSDGPTIECGYAANLYPQLSVLLKVQTTLTETFPDGAQLSYFGYMASFVPNGRTKNEMPTASVKIEMTNRDTSGAEQKPKYTSGAGTDIAM